MSLSLSRNAQGSGEVGLKRGREPSHPLTWRIVETLTSVDPEARSDFLILYTLRLFQRWGPLSGRDALAALGATAVSSGLPNVSYPLLHELEQQGLLAGHEGRPRGYRLTPQGLEAAARLAEALWPRVRLHLSRLETHLEELFGGSIDRAPSP